MRWNFDIFIDLIGDGLRRLRMIPLDYRLLFNNISIQVDDRSIEVINIIILYGNIDYNKEYIINNISLQLCKINKI